MPSLATGIRPERRHIARQMTPYFARWSLSDWRNASAAVSIHTGKSKFSELACLGKEAKADSADSHCKEAATSYMREGYGTSNCTLTPRTPPSGNHALRDSGESRSLFLAHARPSRWTQERKRNSDKGTKCWLLDTNGTTRLKVLGVGVASQALVQAHLPGCGLLTSQSGNKSCEGEARPFRRSQHGG